MFTGFLCVEVQDLFFLCRNNTEAITKIWKDIKMRDFIKKYTFAMLALGVFPIIVYIIFVNTFKSLTGGELAVLIGAILAYYGTVFLGIVAVYQNESLKKLNEKLLQLERGDRATFISFDNDDIDFTIYFEKKEADNENITVFLAEYNKTSDVNDSITLELSLLNTSKHSHQVPALLLQQTYLLHLRPF